MRITRETLERHQLALLLLGLAAGLASGLAEPALAPLAEAMLWPSLAILLFATFTQVPLTHVAAALRAPRFMGATILGNFLLAPLLVVLLLPIAPADPAIRLGVLLVLLTPCTDWAITFTQLGRGDTAAMIAAAPVLLVLQAALLPAYLWLILGEEALVGLPLARLLVVFLLLIALPLALAAWLERRAERAVAAERLRARMGALPAPLLAWVVLLVACGQAGAIEQELPALPAVAAIFLLYLPGALLIAQALGRAGRLTAAQSRALAFSLGTRNSFVVLPLALALPAGWEPTAHVIVLQALIELVGMLVFLRVVPRLFR